MLSLFEDDGNLVALEWGKTADKQPSPLLEEARRQLNAYFDGTLQDFDLPLAPEGASFQRAVWGQLRRIPFRGRPKTYADIAKAVDNAPRAVGGACGRNPIPIIIPCHRVIAKGGRLGGYCGSKEFPSRKVILLPPSVRTKIGEGKKPIVVGLPKRLDRPRRSHDQSYSYL